MERPIVVLAMAGSAETIAADLGRAGFDSVTDTDDALTRLAAGERIDLAVIDCDLPGDTTAKLYGALHGPKPVPTLLLFGDDIPAFASEASSSTDEYAVKPIPSDALVYRLQALLIRGGVALPTDGGDWTTVTSDDGSVIGEGHVVSVFAPKGGVGKTTVSVNLAVALHEQTRSSVLLFDADVGVGNVTSVLAVPYKMGLADLADSPQEEWTDAAFEHLVAVHPASGVRVLTWGSDPAESEHVTVDLLLAALRWAKAHHSYVVVDTHPGYDDRTMAMLTLATEILLVVTPEVGAIRNSSQFLGLAREVGLGEMIRVVVNRANHGVRLPDIEQALNLPVSATVVSNGPKAVIASNEGLPVVTKFPREKIATDLHNVARVVVNGTVTTAPEPVRRSWWSTLVSRTSNTSNTSHA
ncbi:MAG TPA: AAA family ATPase [Candidatus Limnocylindria bacterium]|jgi:pilus assembly protein CpaE|nr:AAA family ATPase [Candidatus Limnocylindria bacterium]